VDPAPTLATPIEATLRRTASVPAINVAHLTHTSPANTVWDVGVGRFAYSQESSPSTGNRMTASRFDSATGVTRGAPPQIGAAKQIRSSAKATLSRYRPGLLRADHEWKVGGEVERGEHRSVMAIPTGVRFVDRSGQPSQSISMAPSNSGGLFITAAAFATDVLALGSRMTIQTGLRFDHSRAVSPDLPALDSDGHETGEIVRGRGVLYAWNMLSPRLGLIAKLSPQGRTLFRASYGRFRQGVLTGELGPFHPGQSKVTTSDFDPTTGGYTGAARVVDPQINLLLDPGTRAPRTDELSAGVDREIGRRVALAIAYVHKDGGAFIGWTDIGGRYRDEPRTLRDGRSVPVSVLVNGTGARRFLLTNPEGYSSTYNGFVIVVEKRPSSGWRAFGSYTYSRAYGLQAYSGTSAAGPQVSTVGAPPGTFAPTVTFGRDPNDLTNARGRLPNDRPHLLRMTGTVDVARTGFILAANLQYSSGKPWAATAQVSLPQNSEQRILLEPRGSRRLSSQSLLDVRVSRSISIGAGTRVELLLDVLNALNDAAEEGLATDNLFSPNFAQPTVFLDPRRAMLGVRVNLGR
jgi:hypothetical protein